eukprot:331686-Pyramimonas_sp.AAC.1
MASTGPDDHERARGRRFCSKAGQIFRPVPPGADDFPDPDFPVLLPLPASLIPPDSSLECLCVACRHRPFADTP